MSIDIKTAITDAPSASKTISVATFQTRLVSLLSAHRKQDATFYGDIVALYDSLKDRDSTLPAALKLVEIDGRSLAKSTFLAWVQVGKLLAQPSPHNPAFAMLSQASLRFLCTDEWDSASLTALYPLSEPELNERILAARKANRSDTTAPRVNAGKAPTEKRVENNTPAPATTSPKAINLSPETLAWVEKLRAVVPSDGDPLSVDAIINYACSQQYTAMTRKPLTMTARG